MTVWSFEGLCALYQLLKLISDVQPAARLLFSQSVWSSVRTLLSLFSFALILSAILKEFSKTSSSAHIERWLHKRPRLKGPSQTFQIFIWNIFKYHSQHPWNVCWEWILVWYLWSQWNIYLIIRKIQYIKTIVQSFVKGNNCFCVLQIGDLKDHYHFFHSRTIKRSTLSSRGRHSFISMEPKVRLLTFLWDCEFQGYWSGLEGNIIHNNPKNPE